MTTITKNGLTVNVPSETVDEYLSQGWSLPGGAAPAPKKKRVGKPRSKSVKSETPAPSES